MRSRWAVVMASPLSFSPGFCFYYKIVSERAQFISNIFYFAIDFPSLLAVPALGAVWVAAPPTAPQRSGCKAVLSRSALRAGACRKSYIHASDRLLSLPV